MNFSACRVCKEALVAIRCLTINTWANRVATSSVITRIFQPYASTGRSHFNLFNRHSCIYVVNNACLPFISVYYCYYCSIYCLSLFDFCLLFIRLFCWIQLSLFIVHQKKYSILILDVFQVFRSRSSNCATSSSSKSINIIHQTASSLS
jgi:hypothetical protein